MPIENVHMTFEHENNKMTKCDIVDKRLFFIISSHVVFFLLLLLLLFLWHRQGRGICEEAAQPISRKIIGFI